MKLSELIKELEQVMTKEGDLTVCVTEPQDYWGTIHHLLSKDDISVMDNVCPDGPKSFDSIRAVVIGEKI